jgi:pimeloyl-ACP methyl ester carboxylesterase
MVFGGKHLETIQEGGYTRKPVFLNSGNRALHYMSRYSTSGAPPVIVGVHGFSHALVDWERAAAEIAGQHGLDFVSMGLSGHYGTSQTSVWDYFSRTTLAGFAGQLRKDLIDVQARFPGMHLAIVAHSMGAPITAMALSMDQAEQGKLADNVSHFIPLSGIGLSQFRTRITPMFLWQIALNTASLLRMRAFALSPYGAWSAFLSKGISPTEFAGFWETHQQESCMVVWEFVRTLFPRWLPWVPYAPKLGLASGTKVTAVHIGGDPLISRESAIDLVEFFRAAGRDATLVDLSSPRASHDIMLTDPEGLARTVANIVSNART